MHALYRWLRRRSNQQDPVAPIRPEPEGEPTPIYISHTVRLIILSVFLIVFALLVKSMPTITSTVFLGATLALILSFPVRLLQYIMPRGAAIAVVTLTLVGGAITGLAILIPFLITEITRFVNSLPTIMESTTELVQEVLNAMHKRGWLEKQPDLVLEDVKRSVIDSTQSLLVTSFDNVARTLGASVSMMISVFGIIFVAIYLLVDIPEFKKSYIRMWAPAYRQDALSLWDTIGYSLSRYLSTQVLSLVIQGTLAFLGLWIIGVPYALILGLVQAVTAILPYIGAWIAFIPAALVATTLGWKYVVAVALLYLLINQLEGNFITPNLQGSAVRVHPILIFLGVIGGSQVFGIMGAVLAVPAIAVIRVISEFFWLRVRVHEDHPTLLSAMRLDTVEERIGSQSEIADAMEADEVTAEEIAELTAPDDIEKDIWEDS